MDHRAPTRRNATTPPSYFSDPSSATARISYDRSPAIRYDINSAHNSSWCGSTGSWGGKAPLSVAMVRFMISELLRRPLSPRGIVGRCRYQMRRNEQARIGHWLARGRKPPPWWASRNLVQ
jgi:hypothetical protein